LVAISISQNRPNRECCDPTHQAEPRLRCESRGSTRMLALKRVSVWFFETFFEIPLLGLFLALLSGLNMPFPKRLLLYSSAVALVFFTTGYLLTTIVVRAFWKGWALWSYPAVATILFQVHFQIMNAQLRLDVDPSHKLRVQVIGGCIVFACTFLGSFVLRRRGPSSR
jgi:hypothetical protein